METVTDFIFFGLQNHCRWWLQPWNLKMLAPWKKSYDQPREHINKQRLYLKLWVPDCWMTSLTEWTWVWASSGRWWWTRKPGVLQSMGSQSLTRPSNWTTRTVLNERHALGGEAHFSECLCKATGLGLGFQGGPPWCDPHPQNVEDFLDEEERRNSV